MNTKNTIAIAALLGASAILPAVAEEKEGTMGNPVDVSVTLGTSTKQVGSFGFTLVDEPIAYAAVSVSQKTDAGTFSLFVKPKVLTDGSYKGTYANVMWSKSLSDTVTLNAGVDLYDAVGYDTWVEPTANIQKQLGLVSLTLGAAAPQNGSNGIVAYATVAGGVDLSDKVRLDISNTTSAMFGDYHGVEDTLGANTTFATFTYDINDSCSAFVKAGYTLPFADALEKKGEIGIGVTYKF